MEAVVVSEEAASEMGATWSRLLDQPSSLLKKLRRLGNGIDVGEGVSSEDQLNEDDCIILRATRTEFSDIVVQLKLGMPN